MRITAKVLFAATVSIIFQFNVKSINASPPTNDKLINERNKLQLEMAKVRLKLLQENKDLRELNERIMKLQKKLVEELRIQPEMQILNDRLNEIQRQLN